MLISASILVIMAGFYGIYDPESAWRFMEWDSQFFWGRTLRRGHGWQVTLMWQCICVVMLGFIGLIVGIQTI